MEVGTVFAVVAPVGVNERLFVRLIVKLVAPAVLIGTVIKTGDQVADVAAVAAELGFNGLHVAVAPVAAVPQK